MQGDVNPVIANKKGPRQPFDGPFFMNLILIVPGNNGQAVNIG
jgi:hypothetical protein